MLELSNLFSEENKEEKVKHILVCNEVSQRFGVALSPTEVTMIMETQSTALYELGRIELEGTIIENIIYAFCDSPYISKYEYAKSINDLVELFYYYRNELDESLNDEEIIDYLKRAFNGPCSGSIEYLEYNQLDRLIHALDENLDIYEDYEYGYF